MQAKLGQWRERWKLVAVGAQKRHWQWTEGGQTIVERIGRTLNKWKNTQRNNREKQNRKIQLKQPKTKANTRKTKSKYRKQIQTNKSKNSYVIWSKTTEEGGDGSLTCWGRVKDLQQAEGIGENRSQTQAKWRIQCKRWGGHNGVGSETLGRRRRIQADPALNPT